MCWKAIRWVWASALLLPLIGCQHEVSNPTVESPAGGVRDAGKQLLLSVPQRKGTAGALLLYRQGGHLYMLLGRERIDGKKAKAGVYSDMGGRFELDGSTILKNIQRELCEETVGRVCLSGQAMLAEGQVLYKKTKKGRDVIYLLYPASQRLYRSLVGLNRLRHTSQYTAGLPRAYLEKDLFLWVRVSDLDVSRISKEGHVRVRDINGQQHRIKVRLFFVKDCLENPDFRRSLKKLFAGEGEREAA